MLIIAHRGNLNGPQPEFENKPDYIAEALHRGFNVEVDVWCVDDKLFLGHDAPDTEIDIKLLENSRIWCHAKNIQALNVMLKNDHIECFFHQNDDVTLTTSQYIWTYPGKEICDLSICVLPEIGGLPMDQNFRGVCTDYSISIKSLIRGE